MNTDKNSHISKDSNNREEESKPNPFEPIKTHYHNDSADYSKERDKSENNKQQK